MREDDGTCGTFFGTEPTPTRKTILYSAFARPDWDITIEIGRPDVDPVISVVRAMQLRRLAIPALKQIGISVDRAPLSFSNTHI
jgi:hypothetical protein